ncbi:MAG: enoyl-CoA hydratase/isomerase family protein [Gammaproteobacteria bacterium]|nr:enoyl-CoA hydratase/isomerase family protein [Gammaproteobacteria bacterium]
MDIDSDALVIYEPRESHAWIRINRPSKRNAMNQAARDGLRAAMDKARERYSVVVLTGVETSFCGGIDLKEVQAEAAQGSQRALGDWRDVNLAIREHPAVFIAAINGVALGGGTTLTGVCDLAIACESASFGMPEVGFGMYPNPAGPATQLARLSRKRAAWMVLTAKRVDPHTAESWGLINQVVPDAELESAACALAEEIAQFDPVTVRECKRALDAIPEAGWADAFAAGVNANDRIQADSAAAQTGLARFSRGERNPGQGSA